MESKSTNVHETNKQQHVVPNMFRIIFEQKETTKTNASHLFRRACILPFGGVLYHIFHDGCEIIMNPLLHYLNNNPVVAISSPHYLDNNHLVLIISNYHYLHSSS